MCSMCCLMIRLGCAVLQDDTKGIGGDLFDLFCLGCAEPLTARNLYDFGKLPGVNSKDFFRRGTV